MRLLVWLVFVLASVTASAQSPLVCIDPGHPSEVGSGTKGKRITELHAAWVVALKLKDELEARGVRVVLTKKTEGQVVRNIDRAGVANKAKADLMVRLHCDAAKGSGFMTVYPGKQGTAKGVTGPSKAVIKSSGIAGKAFHRAVIAALEGHLPDRGLTVDAHTYIGGKQGALTGSIHSRVPVVLAEMCVLTNSHDDAFMSTAKGQGIMAKALADGTMSALAALGRR